MSHSAAAPVERFRYRAAREDGSLTKGVVEAPTSAQAHSTLVEEGLFPISIEAAPARRLLLKRASRQDLAVVFRNVAALTRAGVPVERAMGASEALVEGVLAGALKALRQQVREGQEVSQAMSHFPHVFPPIVIGMVRAGERGSTLPQSLDAIANQLEAEANLHAQVRSALAYPLLVLLVGLVSIFVMGGVVVPRFAQVLGDLGADLPPATRILMNVSVGLRTYGVPAALLSVALLSALGPTLRRPEVRLGVHRFLLRVPLVGPIRQGFAASRTCHALGAMLATGMPLLAALDVASESVGDAEIAERLRRARDSVSQGDRLTSSLSRERVLTSLALQLVGVGESSGDLSSMTARAGDLAAERAHRSLRSLISLVEPALVIGLGALVALTAGALLQAVYSVRPGT